MKSTTVRGTPVNYVGPKGALVGNAEGRTPGVPAGYRGQTTAEQYQRDDLRAKPAPGTPYQDSDGNPDEFSRTAEGTGRYGIVLGAGGIDHNDPAANGSGVVFDGATRANGMMPTAAPYPDSPVPAKAPWFDGRTIEQENRAHLGAGNEDAAQTDLRKVGGVMSRGLNSTSHPGNPENELTDDDTLPKVAPRR